MRIADPGCKRFAALTLAIGLIAQIGATDAAAAECEQPAPQPTFTCDLATLRPLQGAIGMGEVRIKADRITAKPKKERKKLACDPIMTVRGPGGQLFITDHHHGARAWLLAGFKDGICSTRPETFSNIPETFWSQLRARNLIHLETADGRAIEPGDLPKSLDQLPDDPYRTLAYLLRKADGFCRGLMEKKEFAEFIWADWMRAQSGLPPQAVSASPSAMLPTALALAKSPAAKDQPGYRGDKPASYSCPADD
jgi:hypothetical protein